MSVRRRTQFGVEHRGSGVKLRSFTGVASGNKPYTVEEDDLLRAQFPTANLFVLAARMGRSVHGITVRASKLKISRTARIPACVDEQIRLAEHAEQEAAFAALPIWRRALASMPELQRVQTQWRASE
jgi:hypothetical protein